MKKMSLQPQVSVKPFKRWSLDFVDLIMPMSRKKKYILFFTGDFTKWVEAKVLAPTNEREIVNFIYKEILTRLGVPREVITDHETQFTSKLIKVIME